MSRKTSKQKTMSIDQQIQACEEHITRLEQMRRNVTAGDAQQKEHSDQNILELQLTRINKDLDDSYQQMAILKIRRMMGY